MNIEDVKNAIVCPPVIIPTIFKLQYELMLKYEYIEKNNGIHVPKLPGHLDDRKIQYRLKDMFWRFTEEICEAAEEIELHPNAFIGLTDWQKEWAGNSSLRHFFEELVDALHFLTEASIIADISSERIERSLSEVILPTDPEGIISINQTDPRSLVRQSDSIFFTLIRSVGLAANCLKNKPWKVSEMPTDINRFQEYLYQVWKDFFRMWAALGGSAKMLYILYAKKHTVNAWRQKTKY